VDFDLSEGKFSFLDRDDFVFNPPLEKAEEMKEAEKL